MKRIFFSFLLTLTLVLSGCIKPVDNIQPFQRVPAIVSIDYGLAYVLITPMGTLLAPELATNTDVMTGDVVLAAFEINYDQQPYPDYLAVSKLEVEKIGASYALEGGTSGVFDTSIEAMSEDYAIIEFGDEVVFFFIFWHTAANGHVFDYEMRYEIDESEVQTLYVRARKTGEASGAAILKGIPYAFDMSYFVYEAKNAGKKAFKILYNKGGEDGEEDFVEWTRNNIGIME